jgi:hypothetical protein
MTITETVFSANQVADTRSISGKKMIRAGLLMLLFMTTAFGAATWNVVQNLSMQVKLIPVVLFVVVCILVARLYAQVEELAAVRPPHFAQVPLEAREAIWSYWDKNGTSQQNIEHVSRTYRVRSNVVQHLLEQYDARWREQVAMLYWDNPQNEYTASIGIDEDQLAEDAVRLKSGLPIYPIAGAWLCSDCRKRPCHCNSFQSGVRSVTVNRLDAK